MQTISLNLSKRQNYDVLVGTNLQPKLVARLLNLKPSSIFILYDRKVKAYATSFKTALKNIPVHELALKGTETTKSLAQATRCYDALVKAKCDRKTILVALGGGVIGDLAGFVAGTYLRGIRWVGVPSTLLAQVDSSVGGKTGVNLAAGKNLVGVFHQPSLVCCDVTLLKTLPKREWISGLGEMLKYGLTFDRSLFDFIFENRERFARDENLLAKAVGRCVAWKAKIVSQDPCEELGLRHQLNFGHTVGHILEATTKYKTFRHGEAVLLGMRFAARLSVKKGFLAEPMQKEIDRKLSALSCPKPPRISEKQLKQFLQRDKKTTNGKTRFLLLDDLGSCLANDSVTLPEIYETFSDLQFPLRRS